MTDPRSGGQSAGPIRVRFAPSADGHLQVGDVRTALYGWASARHTGGTFVLRAEDIGATETDAQPVAALIETLHWLGLNWDEGPDQDGPYGPYRQSERIGLYHQWAQQFLDTGYAYWCYCTTAERQARHGAAPALEVPTAGVPAAQAPTTQVPAATGPAATQAPSGPSGPSSPSNSGDPTSPSSPSGPTSPDDPTSLSGPDDYDRYCRTLEPDQVQAYLAEGRQPVLRFRMPDGSTTYTDLLRGEITVDHRDVPDFVLMHADGRPLYSLATAVDDVMMRITHIIRGEDRQFATPRQIAVYRAMGLPENEFPVFAHLPHLLDQQGRKLSHRDGALSIDAYRQQGFVPEALVNYLAGLGWSPPGGQDIFTLDDLVGGFELTEVSRTAPGFDPARLETVNGTKIQALTPADFARRVVPFLARAGLVDEPLSSDQMWFIRDGAPLIQDRITRLTEAPAQLAFLLVPDPDFGTRGVDAAAVLTPDAATPLKAATEALAALPDWDAPAVAQALQGALVDDLGLPPETAFDPVRVAITGRRDAPPLPESLALLGRDLSLARLAAAQASLPN